MDGPAALFVRRGGLGDTLLIAPVLAAWRARVCARHGQDVALQVAGVREFVEVLSRYGVCDVARSSEDFEIFALSSGGDRAARAMQRFSAFCAVAGDDPALLGCGVADVAIFDPQPRDAATPLSTQIGRQLGLTLEGGPVTFAPRALSRQFNHGSIAIAPGSGAPQKCWPRARWCEFAARVVAQGERIDVVVGPTEAERDDPRHWAWPVKVRFLADRSCSDIAAQLEGAAAFVGNDSGVTHLASMLGLPTVALFGDGMPVVYGPIGSRTEVVGYRGEFPPAASVHEVLAALQRLRS